MYMAWSICILYNIKRYKFEFIYVHTCVCMYNYNRIENINKYVYI